MKTRALVVIAVLTALAGVLAACRSSQGELEADVRNLPGVVSVVASEADGDDAVPFQNIPKGVRVVMTEDASAYQILDVVSAYDDEGDNLNGVEVTFEDRPRIAFYGKAASQAMIDDLVAARDDHSVQRYQMTGSDQGFWLQTRLDPRPLAELVAAIEQKRAIPGAQDVDVSTGLGRGVVWDPLNDDLAVTRARINFALAMERHVLVRGASISGRGALALFVDDADVPRATVFVERHRTKQVGRVLINPKGEPPW